MEQQKNKKLSTSGLVLILANFTPIFGILFFDWNSFSVIFLYWIETVIIGFYNYLKIKKISNNKFSPWLIFYIIQYPLFLFVYLFLILNIFDANLPHSQDYLQVLKILSSFFYSIFISAAFIFISHGFSWQYNFINKKEYQKIQPLQQVFAPYKRMFIMHVFIVAAAKLADYYNYDENMLAIICLVILKSTIDLAIHLFCHRKIFFKSNLHKS